MRSRLLGAVLVLVLVIAGCGEPSDLDGVGGDIPSPSSTTKATQPSTTVTAAPTPITQSPPPASSSASTVVAPTGPELLMACGAASAPYASTPPSADPLDEDAVAALAVLAANVEGAPFAEGYEWGVWERSDDLLVLLGTTDQAFGDSERGYADAAFEKRDGGWVPSGWGTCHWLTRTEGYGITEWIIDPSNPPTQESSSIDVLATERNCAGGQVPDGREVVSLVRLSVAEITVFVLVEPVSGYATCPSNPPFPLTVDLGVRIGERPLLDGHTIPPTPRWEE